MLSPYEHKLNSDGTECAYDCPACHWNNERVLALAGLPIPYETTEGIPELYRSALERVFNQGSGLLCECAKCGCVYDPVPVNFDCPACDILSYWRTSTGVTVTEFDRDFLKMCKIVPELDPVN